MHRTPPKKKAKELAKLLRVERPDYPYLKSVFRALLVNKVKSGSPAILMKDELDGLGGF